jgi:hypothetical protein
MEKLLEAHKSFKNKKSVTDGLNMELLKRASLKPQIGIFSPRGAAAQRGSWPPHSRGLYITHDAPQSVGLLWTSDQLVAETST